MEVLINDHNNYFGIIGCYFFKNLYYFTDHTYQNITILKKYINRDKNSNYHQANFSEI